jgi:hypothetical protein
MSETWLKWSVAAMFRLAAVVCAMAWLFKSAIADKYPLEVSCVISFTLLAAMIGLLFDRVLHYAVIAFVVSTFLMLALAWYIGLKRAIEYESQPKVKVFFRDTDQ